ncbi:DEAD/DEAH box helicase [Cesiribacter sp. SM1]|uniref:DEAD/DEAH box helicase n=1 Tax=Cesiribacter sp. SM1 TaxID=2861196 RepID=UPI001CD72A84|nr:DEAD/DEAH box helicase [Cesiribacter sp. SM1]
MTIIDRLLKSAPAAIRSRGQDLFQRNKVSLVKEDAPHNAFLFHVRGSYEPYYEVDIDFGLAGEEAEVSCTCPYFEGSEEVCKHIAASLLYLKKNKKLATAEEVLESLPPTLQQALGIAAKPSAKEKQPIVIKAPATGRVDPEKLFKHLRDDFRARQLMAVTLQVMPDVFQAELIDRFGYYKAVPTKATIHWKNGSYQLACSDKTHKGLCDHIHWLALFVSQHVEQNVLELLKEERQEEVLQQMLKGFQTQRPPKAKLEELLEIAFLDDSFRFLLKGPLRGLNAPVAVSNYLQHHIFSKTATPELKQALLLPAQYNEELQRIPGFAIALNPVAYELGAILSLSGKPTRNNDKLASHIALLKTPYEANLSEQKDFTEAFFLKEKFNAALAAKQETLAVIFNTLNQLFLLLPQFPLYLLFDERSFDFIREGLTPRKSDLHQPAAVYSGIRLKFRFFRDGDFYVLKPYLELPDGAGTLDPETDKLLLFNNCLLLWSRYRLGLMNSLKEGLALQPFIHNPVMRVSPGQLKEYLQQVVQPLAQEFPVAFEEEGLAVESVQLEPLQKRLYISELNQYVIFRPVMLYQGDREVNLLEDTTLFTSEEQLTLYERDPEAEESFINLLASLHPSFKPATQQSFFYLTFQQMQEGYWFLKAFETLRKQEVHIFGFNELKNFRFSPHTPSISMNVRSGHDWFETQLEVAFGNNKVSLKELKKAVREGSGYVELTDGTIGILPEAWLKKFEKLFRSAQLEKDEALIPKTHFNLLGDLVDEELNPEVFREIEEKKKRLASFTSIKDVAPPPLLQANLRNYQQAGLNWLNFLREYSWGGILADDMGLGKTLQALALIGLELQERPEQPNLVIAPTTLLFNWKKEIEKFAPSIDFIIHHGERYESEGELARHQLVLTSYGIAVNDLELLKKIKFNLIIADESQAIKNLHAKRHKALRQLQGRVRLAMSGTPIENNIFELYAQMNFVNPGFFQGLAAFKQDYAKPIEQEHNEAITAELRKKIDPFILRRTKKQVLTELPEKTEEYLYCEMGPAQRKVYDAYRNEYRNYLLKKFEEEGVENSQLYVLEGLTRLRQICDSPVLVEPSFSAEGGSAKLHELLTHVQEKTGRHKLLVFSQFVKMLQLVEEQFKKLDIPYEYLDGQTSLKEREKRVQRFQDDPDRRVFLISLKAGGTGLNLTAADYVYLLDPWWNPAVENQAIDRCYRMGQEKRVFAYRMICKDTVEEKIIQLQEQKKLLSEELVSSGEGVMKNLSREDIVALFS